MGAREAVAIADAAVASLVAKEQYLRRVLPDTTVGDYIAQTVASAVTADHRLLTTDIEQRLLHRHGPAGLQEAQFIAQDAAVRRLWQRARVVYDIDPALWAELGDTDPTAIVPPDLFTHLPHPDPFIALPEPLVQPLPDGTIQTVTGFFIRGEAPIPGGQPGERFQVSTHDGHATAIGALFHGPVTTPDGQPVLVEAGFPDAVWTRVTLDPRRGDGTVQGMIEGIGRQFFNGPLAGDWTESVPPMVARAVSLLVYLCADNADIVTLPRNAKNGATRPRSADRGRTTTKPPTPVAVGYRVGAAITAARATHNDERDYYPAAPGQRTVAPHVRRAHFHTYKVGKGRAETRVRWLPPIPINLDGGPGETTVVPVRK